MSLSTWSTFKQWSDTNIMRYVYKGMCIHIDGLFDMAYQLCAIECPLTSWLESEKTTTCLHVIWKLVEIKNGWPICFIRINSICSDMLFFFCFFFSSIFFFIFGLITFQIECFTAIASWTSNMAQGSYYELNSHRLFGVEIDTNGWLQDNVWRISRTLFIYR